MNGHLERILSEVSKSSEIDEGDLSSASERVIEALISGLKIARCGIWMFDEDNSCMRCFLLIDHHNSTRSEQAVLSRKDFPNYFRALDSERVIVAEDAENHPDTREFTESYLKPFGITSMLDTPIRHSGKTVGIICNEHIGEPRSWNENEVFFSVVISDLFGRAINAQERRDYENKLIEANKSLEEKIEGRTRYLEDSIVLLKRIQTKLIESEKMAALGSLVAGVAHEVNTPLGIAITANSHHQKQLKTILNKFQGDTLDYEDLEEYLKASSRSSDLVSENLQRAANLVQNFKKTAVDQQHLDAEFIVLEEYARQIFATLKPLTQQKNVQFEVSGPEDSLNTYTGAIAQILTNLISNSCEHGFNEPDSNNTIQVHFKQLDGVTWEMRYRDNGKGMSQSEVDKIYDPFFTTARAKGGSGLGMSIVYNLITQKLNGSVEVSSKEGEGSQFIMIFKDATYTPQK